MFENAAYSSMLETMEIFNFVTVEVHLIYKGTSRITLVTFIWSYSKHGN